MKGLLFLNQLTVVKLSPETYRARSNRFVLLADTNGRSNLAFQQSDSDWTAEPPIELTEIYSK